MPFSSLPPDLTYRPHPGNNLAIKTPGNGGGCYRGYEGCYEEQYIIFISHKTGAQGYGVMFINLMVINESKSNEIINRLLPIAGVSHLKAGGAAEVRHQ